MTRLHVAPPIVMAVLVGLLGAGDALGQVGGSIRVETPGARVTFAPAEAKAIREYYTEQSSGGKKKNKKKDKADKELPPGLQKKLDRGDPLPPGLAKRSLPSSLESRLQPLPAGYKRYVVGPDIVLVDERRNVVIDIVVNVAL